MNSDWTIYDDVDAEATHDYDPDVGDLDLPEPQELYELEVAAGVTEKRWTHSLILHRADFY